MKITSVKAREILDSRGNPTIEADVFLEDGSMGRASVPSGASTGSLEACELRDKDPNRYHGKGVLSAVSNVNNQINTGLKGYTAFEQEQVDARLCELDGTLNKSNLGANAILAVSLANARAHAHSIRVPLYQVLNQGETLSMPVPMMNILNGGVHANNQLDFQEFMILPIGAIDFPMALRMGTEIFHALKELLKKKGYSTAVGDEGGFAPNLKSNQEALDLLVDAVSKTNYKLREDVVFALDVAASELFSEGSYYLASEKKQLSSSELINYYEELCTNYPIMSLEDGLDENDRLGWKELTHRLGTRVQLVGDDLFVTNAQLLQEGISEKIANAILIKLNQIGTLSETMKAIKLARANHYHCVISHRSGETEDTFIADLAVATGCGQIKTGSLCRTDRVAKYNRLIRINEEKVLQYAGRDALGF